jgi:hypothetical protein
MLLIDRRLKHDVKSGLFDLKITRDCQFDFLCSVGLFADEVLL